MYVFNLDVLNNGDILLIKTDNRLSKIMEAKCGCKFHHAMMYVGESSYIHSDKDPGVQAGNCMRMLFDNIDDAVAVRINDENNREYIVSTEKFVRMKIGTQYSFYEAKRTIGSHEKEDVQENRQFCTRLVAQAYAHSGLKIVEDEDYCTPQDIITSNQMFVIENILRKAEQKEVDYVNEKDTPLQKQEIIHNEILVQARQLTGQDIQTLDQLTDFVIKHQDYDNQITDIIYKSGYIDLWTLERDKNSQNYYFELFSQYYPRNLWRNIGQNYLKVGKANKDRYLFMLQNYERIYLATKLKYAKAHLDLYDNLVQQADRMINTAEEALKVD